MNWNIQTDTPCIYILFVIFNFLNKVQVTLILETYLD